MSETSIENLMTNVSGMVQKTIEALLPQDDERLSQAMRYSVLSSGKRLRPFMLVSSADIFKASHKHAFRAAAAIEMVHSYSLIHDDLPAMDNDDFRRGIPSCHKEFDEATAILAGDSLLTLAFEILADPATHPDSNIRCQLITTLAQNIGPAGIAGGQMYDLIYERAIVPTYEQITQMQWMKTARLFAASCTMGAILGSAPLEAQQRISRYAEFCGLAFQFIDDLDDVANQKPLTNNNIVQIIGVDQTKDEIKSLLDKAQKEIEFFGKDGLILSLLNAQLLDYLESFN